MPVKDPDKYKHPKSESQGVAKDFLKSISQSRNLPSRLREGTGEGVSFTRTLSVTHIPFSPQVAEPRSTRSPGWSKHRPRCEAEPWERLRFGNYSPDKGDVGRRDFTTPFQGLGNLNATLTPGFRSQARSTLGCEYSVPSGLKFPSPFHTSDFIIHTFPLAARRGGTIRANV